MTLEVEAKYICPVTGFWGVEDGFRIKLLWTSRFPLMATLWNEPLFGRSDPMLAVGIACL